MKKAIKLALLVVMVMGASSLFAQKFGRINSNEVISAMPEIKEFQANMEVYAKELTENIETLTVEYNTKMQDLQKNYASMTDSMRDLKSKELNDLRARSEQYEQTAQEDYQKRYNELMAPIYEKARGAINKVSTAGGYTAVFDTSTGSLVYFNETALTDLLPAVKKELGIN